MILFAHWKRVGHMYVDNANSEPGMINPYGLLNVGATYKWGGLDVLIKVNNVFDKLYSTYGYGYDYGGGAGYDWSGFQGFHWPGATRNSFVNISYRF